MQLASLTEPATDEDELVDLLLPQVARFLAREVDGAAIDRDGTIPPAVRQGLARLGLFGLTLPAEAGGAGLSLGGACRVVDAIAQVDRSIAIMIGLHAGLGTQGLVQHGSQALRDAWLPRLASGDCIAAFAATEAGAGSDLGAVRTRGEATEDGLRIDGEKSYVTNGGFAGLFTVLVRTPGLGGARACSVAVVPRDRPGLTIGAEEDKLGIRGSSTVTVAFDGVTIPWSHVLGDPGRGLDLTNGLLAWGRTLMSSGCVGTARAALDITLTYAATRRQFGRTLADLGAPREHLAFMGARVHAMDAIVRAVAASHARGASIEIDSAIAKVFTSEASFEVCDRAVQLHGALGFLEPTGVARQLRDCRITRIFEGANDVLRLRIGAARLASRERGGPPAEPDSSEVVRGLARRLEGAVEDVRVRLGIGAIRRQLVLQRIACAEVALTVSRSIPPGTLLATHAIDLLAEEGHDAIDGIAVAERDEEDVAAVAAALYQR